MGREKRIAGKAGEIQALEFLRNKGYKILERNLRTPFGEIDLVARRGDFIVFIEVKARTTSSLGPPYLSMTRKKQSHLIKNAWFYLKRRGLTDSCWRIDVVSVKLNHHLVLEHIELIENAVEDS